ncbi:unnamed protein product [Brassica oleracea]
MVPKHAFNFWVANLDRLPVCSGDMGSCETEVGSSMYLLYLLANDDRVASPAEMVTKEKASQFNFYHIWRERNDRKHGRPPSPPLAIFNRIDRVTKDIFLARRRNKGCTTLLSL